MQGMPMSRRAATTALAVLLVMNLIVLALNVSQVSRAAGVGLKFQDLIADQGFVRAVKSVAEQCKVNVDLARLECPHK
jgi:hypothetical protein